MSDLASRAKLLVCASLGLFYLHESVTDSDPTPKSRVLFTLLAQILRHLGESDRDPGDLPQEVGSRSDHSTADQAPRHFVPLQLVYRIYRPRMTPLMS